MSGNDDPNFAELMERVRAGSQDAAWELIDRFGWQIHRVIRRTLDLRLRSQFDSTDFVQNVWMSFFRHPEAIRNFSSPRELASFLMAMARNKVIDAGRRRLVREKHNVRRLDAYANRSETVETVRYPGPTPSAVAVARE